MEAVDAAGLLKCDLSVVAIGHCSVQPLPSLCPGQQGHTGGPESPAKFSLIIFYDLEFSFWNTVEYHNAFDLDSKYQNILKGDNFFVVVPFILSQYW